MSEIFTLENENFQLYVKCCAALSLNTLLKVRFKEFFGESLKKV